MKKAASLGRLREISKQRSIRPTLLVPVPTDSGDDSDDGVATKVEWPISR
jgi:hypothetical protein